MCAELLFEHTSILLLWYSWSVLRVSDSLSGEDLGVDCQQKKRSNGDSHIKGSSRALANVKIFGVHSNIQMFEDECLEYSLHTHYIDYRVLYIRK